ncbi:MAG: hypothetical protein WHX53_09385 [Anaerolineae bacterium]
MLNHPILRAGLWVGALLLMAGLLVACGGPAAPAPEPTSAPAAPAATQPPTQPPPTNTTAPPTNTAAPPTATAAPTLTTAPTKAPATPTQAPTAAPVVSADNCVKCHTSEETLRKLAKAEEPTEKLSEGEG